MGALAFALDFEVIHDDKHGFGEGVLAGVFEEDSGAFSIEGYSLAFEVAHGEHGHGGFMVLCGEFGVELCSFGVVFGESVFTNKVIVGKFMDGLDGLGVEELGVGDDVGVLVVFEVEFALGVELFLQVVVVGVGGSELVMVDVCVFDD